MTIRLHIERLVIDDPDIGRADAERLLAALEAELGRRFARSRPESAQSYSMPALALGVRLPEGTGSDGLGREAGAALHKGLRL